MLYVLLPAYNEAGSLEDLLARIDAALTGATLAGSALAYRVVVLDDGSVDGTAQLLERLADLYPLDVIRHRRNRGLGETSRDLFEYAADQAVGPDDLIVRMDADGTHDPDVIRTMLPEIDAGADVVVASRYQPGGAQIGLTAYRRFISRCANLVMKLAFPMRGVRDYSCGYRMYRAPVIREAIELFGNDFIELKGLGFTCTVEKLVKLRMMGAEVREVPFELRYDLKASPSKMLTSLTTLGYLILILKHAGDGRRPVALGTHRVRSVRCAVSQRSSRPPTPAHTRRISSL